MKVSAITNRCPCPKPNFTRNEDYENPVNRKTERNLTVLQSSGVSLLAGITAGGITSCLMKEGAKHKLPVSAGVGLAVAVLTAILTLPAKLYNTKLRAFAKEKEMDVFSRDRELKSNILSEVDKEVKDEDISLDQKINHYTSVQMANNGNGMLIKGA